jgi:hypothetical protein
MNEVSRVVDMCGTETPTRVNLSMGLVTSCPTHAAEKKRR